jgi:hypothetical protein
MVLSLVATLQLCITALAENLEYVILDTGKNAEGVRVESESADTLMVLQDERSKSTKAIPTKSIRYVVYSYQAIPYVNGRPDNSMERARYSGHLDAQPCCW